MSDVWRLGAKQEVKVPSFLSSQRPLSQAASAEKPLKPSTYRLLGGVARSILKIGRLPRWRAAGLGLGWLLSMDKCVTRMLSTLAEHNSWENGTTTGKICSSCKPSFMLYEPSQC